MQTKKQTVTITQQHKKTENRVICKSRSGFLISNLLIVDTLKQNFSLLMLEKEILQKNLTQLQDDHDNILSQQVLGLNKIQSNKVKGM